MSATTEAPPGKREGAATKETYQSAKFVDSLRAELVPVDNEDADRVEALDPDVRAHLDSVVEEGAREREAAAQKARMEVELYGGKTVLRDRLRDALEEELRAHATEKAVSSLPDDRVDAAMIADTRSRVNDELNTHELSRLVDEATLDKVYEKLKAIAPDRLSAIIKQLASEMPEYSFGSKMLDGAQVLEADLMDKFHDLSTKIEASHSKRRETRKGFLAQREQTTKQFIAARRGIDNARKDGGETAVDITAMHDNIEGTYEASKEMNSQINKGSLVSRRKFWDAETKTHIIELVYQVKNDSGKVDPKEAVVEHWNGSKDGGELIRSTYIRVDKETVKGGLQLKFWKGRKQVERDAKAIKTRKLPIGRFKYDLTENARSEMSTIDASTIEASRRTDKSVDGLKGRKAARAKLNGRMMGAMGLSSNEARRASGMGQGRTKSFLQDLAERMFYSSSKINNKKA